MDDPVKIREGLILAGGFGTRLKTVVSEIPKPMAEIEGKPFLEYLLYYLYIQGCRHCVLSVGYKHEYILNYFGDCYKDVWLDYAIEKEPLGTGGGIKNGLALISENNFFLLNGDSFFNVDLKKLADYHTRKKAAITLSVKEMLHAERYGTVEIKNGIVVKFNEKRLIERGFINGGVYVVSKQVFDDPGLGKVFSFEKDILQAKTEECPIFALPSDGYFIDIGIPEDYKRAQQELKGVINFK